ncbi:MAG: hypothetical protein KAI47_19140, partial [Deltaproteobacteria bacterium]|nr:hypothetical protein [Deltaproteobacteria bacterium]
GSSGGSGGSYGITALIAEHRTFLSSRRRRFGTKICTAMAAESRLHGILIEALWAGNLAVAHQLPRVVLRPARVS